MDVEGDDSPFGFLGIAASLSMSSVFSCLLLICLHTLSLLIYDTILLSRVDHLNESPEIKGQLVTHQYYVIMVVAAKERRLQ